MSDAAVVDAASANRCGCRQGFCCGCPDHPSSVGPGMYNNLRWMDHHERCPRIIGGLNDPNA